MEKNKNRLLQIIIKLLLVLVVILVALEIDKMYESYEKIELNKICSISINNNRYFLGNAEDYDISDIKESDVIRIGMVIPENCNIANPVVSFENRNNAMNVYLDDKRIYESPDYEKHAKIYGFSQVTVPIPKDSEKRILSLEITVGDLATLDEIPEVVLANAYDLDRMFFTKKCTMMFYSLFLLIGSIISILIIIFYYGINKKNIRMLWLIAMAVFVSMWAIVRYGIIGYYYSNVEMNYIVQHIFLFLITICMYMYIYGSMQKKNLKLIVILVVILNVIFAVISTILQYMEILYFSKSLNSFHLYMVISIMIISIVHTRDKMNNDEDKNEILLFYFLVLVFIVFYAFLFVFSKGYSELALFFLPTVIFIYMFTVVKNFIIEQTKGYKKKVEKELLLKMAYKDSLTGISNRRAYEKYIEDVNSCNTVAYGVFSFDLDNLKYVNDEFGHLDGDKIIIGFADALQKISAFSFVGRNGGDEFIGFVENPKKNTKAIVMNELAKIIKETNSEIDKDYKIEYSAGYTVYKNTVNGDIKKAIEKADNKMYENKAKKKKNVVQLVKEISKDDSEELNKVDNLEED